MLLSGYAISFDDAKCYIRDKNTGLEMATVTKTQNRMFPLEVSKVKNLSLIFRGQGDSYLWQLRYGHLNIKGLQLLSQKKMVRGLPNIDHIRACEGCIYGKQNRKSFLARRD